LIFISCSPSKRFPADDGKESGKTEKESNDIIEAKDDVSPEFTFSNLRVLLTGVTSTEYLSIGSSAYLINGNSRIALIKPGNKINCSDNDGRINLTINNESFEGEIFFLVSADGEEIVNINGRNYRGKIQISFSDGSINLINIVNIEDYVKGVLAKEMPIGKNEENLEALKALAICIRTYALQRAKDGKVYFDLYSDTRDQVYGGADAETQISNKAVEQTANLILLYKDSPAVVYYHSTCGGYTESSQNVFTQERIPYLSGIKDGSDSYCKISPRFEWKETFNKELVVERLKNYALLDNVDYNLEEVNIMSRFDSGRVDELEFEITDENRKSHSIIVRGNEIRSVLRTADGKNILWSTMFDVSNERNNIVLIGNGFGHGVGLCQWGAIALSRMGWSYEEILEHYYPGTHEGIIND
jgi:stage II sporulation protein D